MPSLYRLSYSVERSPFSPFGRFDAVCAVASAEYVFKQMRVAVLTATSGHLNICRDVSLYIYLRNSLPWLNNGSKNRHRWF